MKKIPKNKTLNNKFLEGIIKTFYIDIPMKNDYTQKELRLIEIWEKDERKRLNETIVDGYWTIGDPEVMCAITGKGGKIDYEICLGKEMGAWKNYKPERLQIGKTTL